MSRNQRQLLPGPSADPAGTSVPSTGITLGAKRHPVKSACLACRNKKRRCNGFRPTCLFCSEQSIPCEYDVKEGYSTKDRHKQELSRLQQDGKSALNFITYLQTESDEKATDLLRFIRSAEKPDIGALATYIQASGYETPSAFLEDSPGAPAGEASSIPVVDPGDESSQPVPHEAAGQQPPLSEPCGTIDYHTEVGWYGSSC